jgi:hypothetical protein
MDWGNHECSRKNVISLRSKALGMLNAEQQTYSILVFLPQLQA